MQQPIKMVGFLIQLKVEQLLLLRLLVQMQNSVYLTRL